MIEPLKECPEGLRPIILDFPCYVLRAGETVLSYVGIIQLWDGVGEVWLTPFPEAVRAHPVTFYRDLVALIELHSPFFQRMHCYTKTDMVDWYPWLTNLGFHCEGTLTRFYPGGEDAYVWARVLAWNKQLDSSVLDKALQGSHCNSKGQPTNSGPPSV